MEISFGGEIRQLRLGEGETFHGEGILAITKALLQSGVAYVGGYQGAPVSHLLDVMVQAEDYMAELGVHVEACSNEASAAAMLGASIHYPLRGAVTWKSVVGTNVAADALSNLASPGVTGGALIVVGEDYGEGASVIQERTHAFAMKSSLLLLDPRPQLPAMVRMVEQGFALSEAANTPAILQLRIRACHVRGSFECRDNVAPAISRKAVMESPARFDYERLSHPPSTFRHEKLKFEQRLPAARSFIVEQGLNELLPGRRAELGIIVQGGLHNTLVRALQQFGLADAFGTAEIPLLVLNVTYPLVPDQVAEFCRDKRAVLVVEEGQPEFIEQEIATALRRMAIDVALHGKDQLQMAGEYNVRGDRAGAAEIPGPPCARLAARRGRGLAGGKCRAPGGGDAAAGAAAAATPAPVLRRLPGAAGVLGDQAGEQDQSARCMYAADIGCHSFATFEPFSLRPLHPRLRHEPGQSARACSGISRPEPPGGGHGRRRLLAQRPASDRRRVGACSTRDDARAAHHEERLHLGHRHAGDRSPRPTSETKRDASADRHQSHRSIAIAASRIRYKGIGVNWLRTVAEL
jgi:indolepyruvate ferredoxin oxidoreductase alpha subunit